MKERIRRAQCKVVVLNLRAIRDAPDRQDVPGRLYDDASLDRIDVLLGLRNAHERS